MKDSDFARVINNVLGHLCECPPDTRNGYPPGDFLPQALLSKHGLLPWLTALRTVHAGLGSEVTPDERQAARQRLVFNETLLLSLMMLHHRADMQSADRRLLAPVVCDDLVRPLLSSSAAVLLSAGARCAAVLNGTGSHCGHGLCAGALPARENSAAIHANWRAAARGVGDPHRHGRHHADAAPAAR